MNRLGFWSSVTITILVGLIDAGMIASTILFPMTSITTIETYARSFSSFQMLPFVPSFILAPIFVVVMLCICHLAPQEKRVQSLLSFSFAAISATILSIHYYIQLTLVQQSILNNELSGLWLFVAPNTHSLFWTFAALGYGFMGIALICAAPIFADKKDRAIKWLFLANGGIGLIFLIGNALGIFIINILVSFIWGVLFPIATALIAKKFRNNPQSS